MTGRGSHATCLAFRYWSSIINAKPLFLVRNSCGQLPSLVGFNNHQVSALRMQTALILSLADFWIPESVRHSCWDVDIVRLSDVSYSCVWQCEGASSVHLHPLPTSSTSCIAWCMRLNCRVGSVADVQLCRPCLVMCCLCTYHRCRFYVHQSPSSFSHGVRACECVALLCQWVGEQSTSSGHI